MRRRGCLAAAVAGVTLLAGCGGASHPGVPPAATPTASTVTTTATLPGSGRPPVIIGDKNFTEEFLLGQLYAKALAAQGFSVELNQNIGPTEVTLQALQGGLLDLYPEYLGTWNTTVAGLSSRQPTLRRAWRAGATYARAHGLQLLAPTPFSDTPAVVVTDAYAASHHLARVLDLRRVAAGLTFGGPPQFDQDAGGLPALEAAYRFTPAAYQTVAVGEQYAALNAGTVQAVDGATTDGELATGGYRVLADPRRVFGFGQAVPVVTEKTLAAEGPQFTTTVNAVTRLLTTGVMRQLNAAVDLYHQDPGTVAEQFLESHGLAPATPPK